MADVFTKKKRSWVMSRIKSKDTTPEVHVKAIIKALGFSIVKPPKTALPGRPDVILKGRNAVVFVHGCFWHRHKGCRYAYTPKTNKKFWADKFLENKRRDILVKRKLTALGYKYLVVWECELLNKGRLQSKIKKWLSSNADSNPRSRTVL